MGWNLLILFIILLVVTCVIILFALRWILFKDVEGATQRLGREAEAAHKREAELNQKIKEADAELQKRKKELDIMEKKMRQELEEQTTKQKEEIITKARKEAEEVITKAQNAREEIRREIEKNMEIKIIDYAAVIASEVLSVKVKEALDKFLIEDFIGKLNQTDMGRISADIKTADVISASAIPEALMAQLSQVFKDKLSRDIKLNPKVDPKLVGGIVLMFESLQLDGSLQNSLRDSTNALKQEVEKQYTK